VIADGLPFLLAATYNRERLYNEGYVFHEVPQVFGHVSLRFSSTWLTLTYSVRSPGFFSRLKEKGTLAKDVWGVIGSALNVRDLMLVSAEALNDLYCF